MRRAPGGRHFYFRDAAARRTGGLSRLLISERHDADGGFRVDAFAYGDFSAATLAEMTVRIVVGNDPFTHTNMWIQHPRGWALDFSP